jgi:molybdopterin/thiamine biosynthesis adenylyltransferase
MSNHVNVKRYDRQIRHRSFSVYNGGRLWGESGQIALASARVCLINATPAGCELLKNLVLPGLSFIWW